MNSMRVDHRDRGAADPAHREHTCLHHLQSVLARAGPPGPQEIAPNYLRGGMKKYLTSHGYNVIGRLERETCHRKHRPEVDRLEGRSAAGKVAHQVQPGPGTAELDGNLKFPFPNPEDIYLHDTPDRRHSSSSRPTATSATVASGLRMLAVSAAQLYDRIPSLPAALRKFSSSCRRASPSI